MKPASFWEAIQMTVCCHLGVNNEDAMSGLSIGRLGQVVLQPYYEHDIREGIMTDEEVIELLELYRIKITCIPMKLFMTNGNNT
ncbi:MAG: pyruvate formate lyase family protein [Sedimentibacter sp.]